MPRMHPEKRKRLRDAILASIQAGMSLGRKTYSVDLARELRCSEAYVCRVRAELIDQGALPQAAGATKNKTHATEESIQARIAIVRSAKVAKLPYRCPRLTMRQLRRALP